MEWASFHAKLYESIMETFIPCPALGLWVWHASPTINTRLTPLESLTVKLSDTRWPIWYAAHQSTAPFSFGRI
ncbi:hypothetical protein BDV39DRAFT_176329 [Aspergillus sergii]|uniref:Uncharacterized protein n=1 Tax=Aspergillus sergii TaxID=1034303 RepID=A0A5N6X3H6_9EURO|nr:hypothetical protein BDV39DRAFT_176329 [Aspergillus sergii]